MTLLNRLTLFCATLLVSLSVGAHDDQSGDLTVDHPWIRATAPGAPVGGGFLEIHNQGNSADVLLGGQADFAQKVTVHRTTMEDGVMKMRKVTDGLEIPAGGSVMLSPGSYHLMFMGLSSRLVEGERVTVTLDFQRAGSIDVEFEVDSPGKQSHQH